MDEAELIDWTSDESHVLLNPRMPEEEQRILRSIVPELPGHVWLATSGTTGRLKLTGLSKQALLASAAAVNRHLEATSSDVWCGVLPTFHVGGLGILARAWLLGARVVPMRWDARAFSSSEDVTLASLVPAQVSDLVAASLRAPAQLRAIVVGGGALSERLYEQGANLGWPLLPSYGMTETCSQVATARRGSPELILLDHAEARVEQDGRLAFRGSSLLTGYATEDGLVDPKVGGWFVTEDLGLVAGRLLEVSGRRGDVVKIGGESVDLKRLDAIVETLAGRDAAVAAVPDARLGCVIHLFVAGSTDAATLRSAYDGRVHPFERARAVHRVPWIPRTPLGKLIRKELLEQVPKSLE